MIFNFVKSIAGIYVSTDDIDLDDIMFFLAVLVGVAIVIWIFAGIAIAARKAEEAKLPVETGIGTLIEKNRSTNALTAGIEDIPAIFELEDGRRIQLNLQASSTLVLGDKGEMTWQGKKLMDFRKF